MSLYNCVCQSETQVSSWLKRGFHGPGRRICTKPRLYTLITRGYSGQGLLRRRSTRSAASASSTQLLPCQENETILCKKYPSRLVVIIRYNASIFHRDTRF